MQLQEHIARFFTGQTGPDERLSHFGDWWKTRPGFGEDTLPNNVDIRSYLLERRFAKDGTEILQLRLDAIRSLYTHLQTEGHIQKSPFDGGAFPQLLASAERKRRSSVFKGDDAEIVRLKALNTLADRVNQASNVASVLQNALEILVEVMNLETAWAFLRSDLDPFSENDNPHGYTLAAKSALPPGLQADDCRFLCKAPACYCQNLLNAGRLSRAVNVVECSRLMDAARSEGDTKGLRFHATVPLLGAEGTHGLINIATDSWEILDAADLQLLTTAGAHIAVALDRARLFGQVEEQHRRLASELQMARNVQRSLLPTVFEEIPNYEIQAHWEAAREVAGDFYDVFQLPGNRSCIVLADVSGKGAPAALYMAMTRSIIRSEAPDYENPAALAEQINRRLRAESGAEGMFLTAFIGYLDPLDHTMEYVIAGHEAPLLCEDGQVSSLPGSGGILGLLDGFEWTTEQIALTPGATILVYTDGLTDARNSTGDDFGIDRLTVALTSPNKVTPRDIVGTVDRFRGDVEPIDDVTVLTLTRKTES